LKKCGKRLGETGMRGKRRREGWDCCGKKLPILLANGFAVFGDTYGKEYETFKAENGQMGIEFFR